MHLPFGELSDPPPAGVDSVNELHDGDPRLNPFHDLPSVQELLSQRRESDSAQETKRRTMVKSTDAVTVGVDVARFGTDSTAIAVRLGNRIAKLSSHQRENTMATAGRIAAIIRQVSPQRVFIDEIGLGAGVVDRLKELGHRCVRGVNVAVRSRDPDKYANLRAELFDALRQRFERRQIRIPPDPELVEQLSSIRYSFTSSGQVQLESKESMSRRGIRSPDKADAVALAFVYEPMPLRAWL